MDPLPSISSSTKPLTSSFVGWVRKRLVLVAAIVCLLLLCGLYVANRAGIISLPFLQTQTFESLLMEGAFKQQQGDFDGARAAYEESLSKAESDEARGRTQLRIATIDAAGDHPEEGIKTLKELSADTRLSDDVRARAALLALLTFANNRSLSAAAVQELFSGEPWNTFYPTENTSDVYAQDAALVTGYEYVLSMSDLYYAHFLAGRILAMLAQKATDAETRNTYATDALNHINAGYQARSLPTATDYWAISYVARMDIEGARALMAIYPLIDDTTVIDQHITKQSIAEAFEDIVTYCSDKKNQDADSSIYSTKLLARFYYASFLSQFDDMRTAEQEQIEAFLDDYAHLPPALMSFFRRDFAFLKVRGDAAKYPGDTRRAAAIRMALHNEKFKTFLIDSLGGWDENDFK